MTPQDQRTLSVAEAHIGAPTCLSLATVGTPSRPEGRSSR